jgi:hypothetical protein
MWKVIQKSKILFWKIMLAGCILRAACLWRQSFGKINWKMTLKRIYYAEDLSKSCSNELPVYKRNDDQYSSQRKNDENVFGWSSLKKWFKIIIKIAKIF